MIQLFNVTKAYCTGVKALADVSLQITRGEFVFLVGPSGAGKSTLIRLLIREESPTRGQIMIGGRSILRLKRREIPVLRRNIGIVFQDFRLLADRTAFENIAFALEVQEYHPREIKARVAQILDMIGLQEKSKMYPHQLAGGEQQRVAIARAVVGNPRILIADEPTGNLDPENAWGIVKLLSQINERGTTLVMATHNREIVNTMRKRVIALQNGELVRDEADGRYRLEA